MPQSLSRIILHIIFSTKDRLPTIDDEIRPRLHGYLATIFRSCDGEAYRVGGVADHVHVACLFPRTITLSKLIETVKKDSSKWMKQQGTEYSKFYWQRGYGTFSVSPPKLDTLIEYIDRQHEHHKKESFQDEFRRFLRKYQIQYDERYVWD